MTCIVLMLVDRKLSLVFELYTKYIALSWLYFNNYTYIIKY